jgi:hypothetical protein
MLYDLIEKMCPRNALTTAIQTGQTFHATEANANQRDAVIIVLS